MAFIIGRAGSGGSGNLGNLSYGDSDSSIHGEKELFALSFISFFITCVFTYPSPLNSCFFIFVHVLRSASCFENDQQNVSVKVNGVERFVEVSLQAQKMD